MDSAITSDFIGFKNYVNLFKDGNVGNAYWFTFKFAVVVTILINIFSLLIAMGLNARIKARNFFRGIYFLPNILSVLIIGYIFNYLFSNVFTIWGQNLGIEWLSTNILGSEQHAWIGIVVVAVWQGIAYNTILYLAGSRLSSNTVRGVQPRWGEPLAGILKITFPLIAPFFTINMVLGDEEFPDGLLTRSSLLPTAVQVGRRSPSPI